MTGPDPAEAALHAVQALALLLADEQESAVRHLDRLRGLDEPPAGLTEALASSTLSPSLLACVAESLVKRARGRAEVAVEDALTEVAVKLDDLRDGLLVLDPDPPYAAYAAGLSDGVAASARVVRRRLEELL